MANGGQIDILVAKKAIAELDKGIAKIDLMNTSILELSKSVRTLNTDLTNVKTPKGLETRLKANEAAQKKSVAMTEKIKLAELKLQQQREKFAAQEKAFREKQKSSIAQTTKARIAESDAIRRNKIALDKQRKSMTETSRAYKKLSESAIKARKTAQDLGAAYGTTSKRFKTAAREANNLNNRLKRVDAATGNYQRSVGNYGSAMKGAIGFTRQMVSALGLMGGAFLAVQVIRDAANTIKEFNKEGAVLASILQKDVKEIKALTNNAKELGAVTAKTANEVIKLQIAFARLGFTQQEIIDLTGATIEGSIAMNAELDQTANLVGAVVNSMDELSTTDAPRIIDVLSLSTAKSALNFEKLRVGLPIVLGAANALNVPLTEVVATLGKLADGGIETSTAATSLRNIFIESAKKGIDYKDALEKITNSTDKLKTANEIFGKRAAVSALIIANNTDNVKELDVALQNAAGTAKEMADKQLDTLSGSLTLLSSAWDGFVLSVEDGEGALSGFSRSVVDTSTVLLNLLSDVNNISDGFTDFFGNLFKLTQIGGAQSISIEAAIKKQLDERKTLLTELVDLIDLESRKTGFGIDKSREFETQNQKTTEQIKEYIKFLTKKDEVDEKNIETIEDGTIIMDGSINSLKEIIAANNKLIDQATDSATRKRLREENALYQIQLDLISKAREFIDPTKLLKGTLADDGEEPTLTNPLGIDIDNDITGFESVLDDVVSFREKYQSEIGQAIDVTNAFFDNRIDRIQQDRDASAAHFDNLIEQAEGNQELQKQLQFDKRRIDEEFQRKQNEEAKKQLIINRGIAIANTVINTAAAVVAALAPPPVGLGPVAGIPLAVITGALGLAQVAAIASAPLPKFKDGTINPLDKDTLAITGDGGKREPITKNGELIGLSPSVPTLTYLPKGSEVHKDMDSFASKGYDMEAINKAAVMTSIHNDGKMLNTIKVINDFNMNLDGYQRKIENGIKNGFKRYAKTNISNTINIEDSKYSKEL